MDDFFLESELIFHFMALAEYRLSLNEYKYSFNCISLLDSTKLFKSKSIEG